MANYINPDRNVVVPGLDPVVNFESMRLRYESITAAKELTVKDSGKLFGLNLAAGFTVTLPAIADAEAGWFCELFVGTVTTSNNYIITEKTSDDTDKIVAFGLEVATTGAQIYSAGCTTITFQATPSLGDHVRIFCDGSRYIAKSITQDDAGVAFA